MSEAVRLLALSKISFQRWISAVLCSAGGEVNDERVRRRWQHEWLNVRAMKPDREPAAERRILSFATRCTGEPCCDHRFRITERRRLSSSGAECLEQVPQRNSGDPSSAEAFPRPTPLTFC